MYFIPPQSIHATFNGADSWAELTIIVKLLSRLHDLYMLKTFPPLKLMLFGRTRKYIFYLRTELHLCIRWNSLPPAWWRPQMETFSVLLALYSGNSVNSPHKGQWCGALTFSLISAWTNGWVNNRDAGDLRRHRAHYDVAIIDWHRCVDSILYRGLCIRVTFIHIFIMWTLLKYTLV